MYGSNKYIGKLLADGLIFKRNNPSKRFAHPLYRYSDLLDYDSIQANTSEQILDLILKLRTEMTSFEDFGINYEEKAIYDILDMICKQYGFEFDKDKMLELAREIKKIIDDTARFLDWSDREDIKA